MKRVTAKMLALSGAVLLLAGGCTAARPRWPAVSDRPTGLRVQGRWVWAELFTENVAAAKTFYHEVFGWQFESYGTASDPYTLVRVDGRPIAGIVHYAKAADAERSGRWLVLMSVPDVAGAAKQAGDSGGKVLVAPTNFRGRGEAAVLTDPEGALFGVIRTDAGDPLDAFPPLNAWYWIELWARDASRMADFYRHIGAYTVMLQEGAGDRPELDLVAGGYPRAAILELQRKDVSPTWLPYVRVKDLRQTLASVARSGGRIVVEPSPDIRDGKVAVFIDPLGAAVAVVESEEEDEGEGKP